jgi:hypothetical protein
MLNKMVDGKEVVCSAEEEASIRTAWAANDASKALTKSKAESRKELQSKFGDMVEFLDKLCRKLGIDPAQKDSW